MKLLFAIVLFTGLVICAEAAVLHVAQDGTGDFITIQDAVNAAADGDTVIVQPDIDTYDGPITISVTTVLLGRGVGCNGEASAVIAGGRVTFATASSGSVLSGFKINGELEAQAEVLTIQGCIITGGGYAVIARSNSSVRVNGCYFNSQTGGYGENDVHLTIENSIFRCNAGVVSVALDSPPRIVIRNCNFYDSFNYGAVTNGTAEWTIDHCIFWNVWNGGPLAGTWQVSHNAYSQQIFPFVEGVDTVINDNPWITPTNDPCSNDFHLLPGSGLFDRGDPNFAPDRDGSRRDIGVFGGPTPYVSDMTPAFPFVTSISVPSAVPQNGVLEIRSTGKVGQGS